MKKEIANRILNALHDETPDGKSVTVWRELVGAAIAFIEAPERDATPTEKEIAIAKIDLNIAADIVEKRTGVDHGTAYDAVRQAAAADIGKVK